MYRVEYYDKAGAKHEIEMIGSELELRDSLAREGKIVISVKKQVQIFQPAIQKAEIIAALTAIGDMLSVGISISRALPPVISSFPKDSRLAAVLAHITKTVKEGKSFSQAMAMHPMAFGQTVITMIEAGEVSGKLAQTFVSTAEYMRTMEEVKGELIKKLTYPCILFGVAILSLLLNSMVVIPKLMKSPLFKMAMEQTKGKEDLASKAVMLVQHLKTVVPSFLGICAVLVTLMFIYYKTNQEQCEGILFKVPMARELLFYQAYYISFLALANLMSVGVRLDQALYIAGKGSHVQRVKTEFAEALRFLKDGEPFTRGIPSLNAIERTMLETAQSSDRVISNISLISKRFYNAYISAIKKIAPRIYALVIILVCAIIIIMLLAIMLPYSKMLQGMK